MNPFLFKVSYRNKRKARRLIRISLTRVDCKQAGVSFTTPNYMENAGKNELLLIYRDSPPFGLAGTPDDQNAACTAWMGAWTAAWAGRVAAAATGLRFNQVSSDSIFSFEYSPIRQIWIQLRRRK